jgi:GTP cyclohydrolase-4
MSCRIEPLARSALPPSREETTSRERYEERAKMAIVYLGLGSNLGERRDNIVKAIELLGQRVTVERVSSLYETEPVGYREQPKYLNSVCQIITPINPQRLLTLAKEIESALGREPGFPNSPRPIDVDILFYGTQVINTPELTIPHPHLEERAFVLVPLAELAPELVHPVNQKTIKKLLGEVEGLEGVRKWNDEKES